MRSAFWALIRAKANEASMQLRDHIDEILANDRLDDELSEMGKVDAIEGLIGQSGWEAVRECLMDILRDDRQERHWRRVADVFWGAVLDRRELPADELIAWLYHRFDPDGQSEDNEVWSITSKLKGVGYLSDYNPLRDPAVLQHLRAIRGGAGSR